MSSESPATKKKPSAPRKETPECQTYDMALPNLFPLYFRHTEETSVRGLWSSICPAQLFQDAPTNGLLRQFDRAAKAGLEVFEAIAKVSKRLVDIDVALTSHRGMLLDTLDSLNSEYDLLLDTILRALFFMGSHLLVRRAPLRPPGRSCVSGDKDALVKDWEQKMEEIKNHSHAIEECRPKAIEALKTKLATVPSSPAPSWLPFRRKNINIDMDETIDIALEELIRVNTAFMFYRAGCRVANRTLFEHGRVEDLKKSPLVDLLGADDDYLRDRKWALLNMIWLDSYL
ncbi:hypothetical protein FB45DRAFT_942125 [Roridomyces roridus]|uniref:Uncharacterized protein n=1 Tax=Roridomyces roridus TaxID=1738132 RepID=A0AAD7F9Q2_9AGAR|nr:hypothetical protein FB45DRAFT_942125 [Roridomyces roridus]